MPTPFMGLTLPTDHNSNDLWGNLLNQAFGLVDAHRHLPGEGRQVPSNGINIDNPLNYNGFLIKTLGGAVFTPSAVPGFNTSLFVSNGTSGLTANELYYRGVSGNVKMTDGGTINLSFAGGIVDDYAVVGARLGYDDGLKRYTFKEGTIDAFGFARLHSGPARLSPFGATTGGNFVELACPGAIASPYTVTWPLAPPAATAIAQVDNTGLMTFSNALAVNQSITVSGTGDYKHGTRTLTIAGADCELVGASKVTDNAGGSSGTLTASCGIRLPIGSRILAVRAFIQDNVTGPTKLQMTVASTTAAAVLTTIGTSVVSAGDGSNQTLSVTGLTTTMVASNGYGLRITTTTGATGCSIRFIEVDYDRP